MHRQRSLLGLGILEPVPGWSPMLSDARLHLFDPPRAFGPPGPPSFQVPFWASSSWKTLCATNSILERTSKWGYDVGVLTFHKGDCEHCSRIYHYTLLHAGFGDYSYAYCDSCGTLATIDYSCSMMTTLPPISVPHQVIDAAWEQYLRPCECGGHFRRGAAPRCVHCNQPLSAEHAADHIEHNSIGAPRGWRWQRNWTEEYCIALENPESPGSLCQVHNPFFAPPPREKDEKPHRHRWSLISSIFD